MGVSNSTPEAEIVATAHALRQIGLPALEFLQKLLPHSPKMWFLEDNQAMLQCCKTGRNPTMRHLLRSHRVSVAWIHEQYKSSNFKFAHESGEAMPPDVFTKMFADKEKWKKARQLISILLPDEFPGAVVLNEGITKGILEKPALAAPVSPSGGIRTIAPSRGVLPKLSRHFYDSVNGIPRPSRALPRQEDQPFVHKCHSVFRKALFTPIGHDDLPQNRDLYTGDRFTIGMLDIAETFSVTDNWFNQSEADRQLDRLWKGHTYLYLKAPLYHVGFPLSPMEIDS